MSLFQFIECNVYLAVLVLLYKYVFQATGFLRINRILLLALPWIAIIPALIHVPKMLAIATFNLPAMQMMQSSSILRSTENTIDVTGLLLLIGASISMLILIYNLSRLARKKKILSRFMHKDVPVLIIEDELPSHSFLRTIYLNKEDLTNQDIILNHEFVHAKELHSLDVIFAQFVKSILWFNPLVYLWERLLRENHEYLADKGVHATQISRKDFAEMILSHTIGLRSLPLSSAFSNQHILGKRIEMFDKLKPKTIEIMKYLVLIPILAGLTIFSACSKSPADAQNDGAAKSLNKADGGEVVMAEYPGGPQALMAFLSEHVEYPQAAKDNGNEGKVFVKFDLNELGIIENAVIEKGVSVELDAEALRAVKMMPNWSPATKDGKPIRTNFVLPIVFQLK